jgi:isoleucyl-tRNA synthetase
LRFLLANLADFDIEHDAVAAADMLEIDRYALALARRWQSQMEADYQVYEFHPAMSRLQTFCSEDLGAFYLDILKDRLYTTAPTSPERRSAQTALWHITSALLRVMAPVLSFTAEEAWPLFAPTLHKKTGGTIFTQTWHAFPEITDADALLERWARLRVIRAEVLRELEGVRSSGAIGSSLQAEVELALGPEDYALVTSLKDDLRFVLITSQARAVLTSAAGAGTEAGAVRVTPSAHAKCERCWHWRADVGADTSRPGLCGRCVSNLDGPGEYRRYA